MQDRLNALAQGARSEISAAEEPQQLEAIRTRYLGKKGELSQLLSGMGQLPPDERRALGEVVNRIKMELEALLTEAERRVEELKLEAELRGPKVDISLPGRHVPPGRRHPVSATLEDIVQVFRRLGFEVAHGPEIEQGWYNFDALQYPADHPARDSEATFFVDAPWVKGSQPALLRTHTLPVQLRTMLQQKPPVRAVTPGRVYRTGSDVAPRPVVHEVGGLWVDKGVTFAELKGLLEAFSHAFFGAKGTTRFRPTYFPFTEPSTVVDVGCIVCHGKGCGVCKQTGWVAAVGAGMVHPNVFKSVGYESADVTGCTFAIGVERLAMLRYGIDDLGPLFANDVRILAQF